MLPALRQLPVGYYSEGIIIGDEQEYELRLFSNVAYMEKGDPYAYVVRADPFKTYNLPENWVGAF